jgi:hypothetical protein
VTLVEAVSLFVDLLHNPEASVAREVNEGETPWQIGDYLTAHVWSALTGEKHPALPKDIRRAHADPRRQAAINRALERKRERERAIAAGDIT